MQNRVGPLLLYVNVYVDCLLKDAMFTWEKSLYKHDVRLFLNKTRQKETKRQQEKKTPLELDRDHRVGPRVRGPHCNNNNSILRK